MAGWPPCRSLYVLGPPNTSPTNAATCATCSGDIAANTGASSGSAGTFA
jgi:hypothetical protein